jgi:hypothetical protein
MLNFKKKKGNQVIVSLKSSETKLENDEKKITESSPEKKSYIDTQSDKFANIYTKETDTVLIIPNNEQKKFIFKDKNTNEIIGEINIHTIIKYSLSYRIKNISREIKYNDEIRLIEQYICKFNHKNNLIFQEYSLSPFMRNPNLLIILFEFINFYETQFLPTFISGQNEYEPQLIQSMFNNFFIEFIIHSLVMFSTVINNIMLGYINIPHEKPVTVLSYNSLIFVTKITTLSQREIKTKKEEIDRYEKYIKKIEKNRKTYSNISKSIVITNDLLNEKLRQINERTIDSTSTQTGKDCSSTEYPKDGIFDMRHFSDCNINKSIKTEENNVTSMQKKSHIVNDIKKNLTKTETLSSKLSTLLD